ncbi:hypothetical protein IVB27_26775 [Bradyrhizobium sp. 197]|nr:hypothetical protein [Bradyrhizobium sp. 197]
MEKRQPRSPRVRQAKVKGMAGNTSPLYETDKASSSLRHVARRLAMFRAQNGVCFICQCEDRNIVKKTGKRRELAVDHCHESGTVRSLLCGDCNRQQ